MKKGWGAVPPYFDDDYYSEDEALTGKLKHFYVEVLLIPREKLEFNPSKISLVDAHGKQIFCDKILGPSLDARFPGSGGYGLLLYYKERMNADENVKNAQQVFELSENEKVGFALRFELSPPKPGESFSILFNGLSRRGEPVGLKAFRYGEAKKIEIIYN